MKSLSIWNYLLYFCLAVFIEIIATAPIWGLLGAGPGGDQSGFLIIAFVFNLPTVLVTWSLGKATGAPFFLLTPLTQILFWFCILVYFARRKRTKFI
jgi:O-antigen/teichoic acid export membrane protein